MHQSHAGFVTCVGPPGREGGQDAWDVVLARAAIQSLRNLGVNEPVVVFHVNGELPSASIEMLESMVRVIVQDTNRVPHRG